MESSNTNYKILDKKLSYKGFGFVENYIVQNRLFSGEWSKPYSREIFHRYNVVAALPYDPIADEIVLIEQFRVGALWQENKQRSPWLLELVAGVLDDATESKEDAIRREVQEETGLQCLNLKPIYTYLSSPGFTSEEITIYLAEVDAKTARQFAGLVEENEDIKIHIFPAEQAFAAVKQGLIYSALTIIALQWLELNKIRK